MLLLSKLNVHSKKKHNLLYTTCVQKKSFQSFLNGQEQENKKFWEGQPKSFTNSKEPVFQFLYFVTLHGSFSRRYCLYALGLSCFAPEHEIGKIGIIWNELTELSASASNDMYTRKHKLNETRWRVLKWDSGKDEAECRTIDVTLEI